MKGRLVRSELAEQARLFSRFTRRSNPSTPTIRMTYLIIGLSLLIFGIYFFRQASKDKDKEGVIGFSAIIIAAVILILFFGLFYQIVLTRSGI